MPGFLIGPVFLRLYARAVNRNRQLMASLAEFWCFARNYRISDGDHRIRGATANGRWFIMADMKAEKKRVRVFEMHGSKRVHELEGVPLATFPQRALGYWIDVLVAVAIWVTPEFLWRRYLLHESHIEMKWDFHEPGNIIVMVIYWAAFIYFANGRTPGKWVARTRIVSLTGERMGLWQSVERVLGYGAAILEGGLGFLQFFWDKNRMCAQDRLAETIVVDVRKQVRSEMRTAETETVSSTG